MIKFIHWNKMKTMKLTVAVLVAIGFIVESVEPCSEDLIKEMAVEACGLDFRSIFPQLNESVYHWLTNPKFKMNSMSKDDVEREYRKIIGDDYGRGEDLISNNMINIKDLVFLRSAPKTGDIARLVKECCHRKCTVDDFRDICDKK